jgi:hypothetical protein
VPASLFTSIGAEVCLTRLRRSPPLRGQTTVGTGFVRQGLHHLGEGTGTAKPNHRGGRSATPHEGN